MTTEKQRAIARLNDQFRATLGTGAVPGRALLTRGIASEPTDRVARILQTVRTFDAFTPDNDPWHEHDCAGFEDDGDRILWKIDYYDNAEMEYGAEDPRQSYRVLTIMFASEY